MKLENPLGQRTRRETTFARIVFSLLLIMGVLDAQLYMVGDSVANFTAAYCANENGDFSLSDLDGDVNGGEYSVIWLVFFASW
ncbi:MAG: hypothetical protein V3U24_02960 [Candidatus Neomarinimicrobiota bacterium]